MMYISELSFVNKVKVGKFHWPAHEADLVVAKSVRKLVTMDKSLPDIFGQAGSVTLLKMAGRKYAFFTSHQLGRIDLKNIDTDILDTIMIPSLSETEFRNLPMNVLHHCTEENGEEYLDILALGAEESSDTVKQESCYFFPVSRSEGMTVHSYFYVGYPNLPDNINYSEYGKTEEIRNRCSVRECKLDEHYSSSAAHFKRFLIEPSQHLVDGLSGGAVFSFNESQDKHFEVLFEGIITRANKEKYLHVIDKAFILKMANSF